MDNKPAVGRSTLSDFIATLPQHAQDIFWIDSVTEGTEIYHLYPPGQRGKPPLLHITEALNRKLDSVGLSPVPVAGNFKFKLSRANANVNYRYKPGDTDNTSGVSMGKVKAKDVREVGSHTSFRFHTAFYTTL